MESRELTWRARKAVQTRYSASGLANGRVLADSLDWTNALEQFRESANRPILLDRVRAHLIRDTQPELVDAVVEAADRVVQGSFQFFGYPAVSLGDPIDWNRDPIAGVRWPELPARRINHRVEKGDVKWIWELNRLQHLPWLAQAWLFTGDSRYSAVAFEHLDSWLEQNRPGRGIAWRGSFEAGIRAISVAIALQGLRDAPELTVERYRRIVEMLAHSAKRCWHDRSLYSSGNNHLIGEMTGLAVIAILFPELQHSAQWERSAIATLSAESDKQILSDGAGAEQAVGYQAFTVELLHLVAVLLEVRDGAAPAPMTRAVARSTAYLSSVVGTADPAPRYGDEDEGFAVRLGHEPVRSIRDHLAIVSAFLPSQTNLNYSSGSLDACWFSAISESRPRRCAWESGISSVPREFGTFAESGGLVVLRSGARRVTMDVGPLGYLSIAAHGHADALSVTMCVDHEDVISDPGTGSYYGHPQWRSVMRSTRAHSTVCVDGQDQSVNSGPFIWHRHAQTKVHKVDLAEGIVDAEHDGYRRLPGRITHRRWLIAPPGDDMQLIVDLVAGTGSHEIRTTWPLHPSIESERIDLGHKLFRRGVPIRRVFHASTVPFLLDDVHGDAAQDLGWWSGRLESRVPAWWLGAVATAELPVVMATLFTPEEGSSVTEFGVSRRGNRIGVDWVEADCEVTATVHIDRFGEVEIIRKERGPAER